MVQVWDNRTGRAISRRARGLVLSTLARGGYTIAKVDHQSMATMSDVEVALRVLVQQRNSVAIVQVGANDGQINDPVYGFVMAHADRTRCLLIEPQEQVIPMLAAAYSSHPDVTIVNKAVGDDTVLTLYGVTASAWPDLEVPYAADWPAYRAPTGIVSADPGHVRKWVERYYVGPLSSDSVVERFDVPSQPLPDILDGAGWDQEVDLLQVDVEGFDDMVIYASDLAARRPALVHFEHAHLPQDRRKAVWHYLEQHGYSCASTGRDTLAIREVAA